MTTPAVEPRVAEPELQTRAQRGKVLRRNLLLVASYLAVLGLIAVVYQ